MPYDEKDAARDTGVSVSEVKACWHNCRNDSIRSGEKLGTRGDKSDAPPPSGKKKQEDVDKWGPLKQTLYPTY